MTELLIRVDSNSQCPRLAGFLRRCHAQPRMLDEHSSRSNSMTTGVPGSRRSSRRLRSGGARRAGEVSLTLGDEVRVLRTET
jgi:hypothetical protein